jgi:hypothetical protein
MREFHCERIDNDNLINEIRFNQGGTMKLKQLKIACYLYNNFTDYDSSYLELRKDIGSSAAINPDNCKALMKWLRSWGCRQFVNECSDLSKTNLISWFTDNQSLLPDHSVHLIDFDLSENTQSIELLFDSLKNCIASIRSNSVIHVGPVGAAKLLFAIRPNMFAPWDNPIFKHLKHDPTGKGYVAYLRKIQAELKELKIECNESGIQWEHLFTLLNKQHHSYPKLIDEYYWISITNNCKPEDIIRLASE